MEQAKDADFCSKANGNVWSRHTHIFHQRMDELMESPNMYRSYNRAIQDALLVETHIVDNSIHSTEVDGCPFVKQRQRKKKKK